jgi:hypothetical protein
MKLVNLPFFVELGAALEAAEKVEPTDELFSALFRFYPLRSHLEQLSCGQHARLSATQHDLADLQTALDSFESKYFRDEKRAWRSPGDDERAEYEISSIVSKIKQLKMVLIAELRTSTSFVVTRAGIFDVNLLVNGAHEALDDDTIRRISKEVCDEFDAAGKCLAFNLPTAAGFHAMRAVERVIKRYLAEFMSQAEISKLNNWGHYIASLERISASDARPKPSHEAIALLRQIKDIYRNPVIHPERILNSVEASTIFHSTIAAVSRVVSEFKEEEKASLALFGSTPPSALANALLGNRIRKDGATNSAPEAA